MADLDLPQREGYAVHPTKVGYADELFATCRRLHFEKNGRPDLRALARWIGLKGQNTLRAELRSAGDPHLEILRRLATSAGVPLVRSLAALGASPQEIGHHNVALREAARTPIHARLCAASAQLWPQNAALALRVVEQFLRAQRGPQDAR